MRLTAVRQGFTLLELLIVVVVIGVLSSLALTRHLKTVDCRYQREARDTTDELLKAEQIYRMQHGVWTADIAELPLRNPNRPNNPVEYSITLEGPGDPSDGMDDAATIVATYTAKSYGTTRCVSEQGAHRLNETDWPCPRIAEGACP